MDNKANENKSDGIFSKFGKKLDEIAENTKQWDMEEFLNKLSEPIDKEIIDTVKTKKLTYQGGDLVIETTAKKNVVNATAKLYFQDSKEEWTSKTNKLEYKKFCFTAECIKELEIKGKVEYPIESPIK